MVMIKQKNTWFCTGRYSGEYKYKGSDITIPNSAIIYTSQHHRSYFYTNRINAKKQLKMLEKNDQVLAFGFIKVRKNTTSPLYVIHSIMKIPVPNISLKNDNGLDVEYQKYLDAMANENTNDIELVDLDTREDDG